MDPQTRYARSGDLSIAYQVVGDGPVDLVFVPGFASHVELGWGFPPYRELLRPLTRFCRLVIFDKRGVGLSDRDLGWGTLEDRMDDVRAVMDAVGLERASVLGASEGGPLSILFAASYPERVSRLVLCGSFARVLHAPDYEIGLYPQWAYAFRDLVQQNWGTGFFYRAAAQNAPDDEKAMALAASFERNAATPKVVGEVMARNVEIDVRPALPLVRAPSLILHFAEDPLIPSVFGRYLADHLPDARFVELPGEVHASWRSEDYAPLVAEIEQFLTGSRRITESGLNRVFATVLFTDIVDSTQRASSLGDRRWGELLDGHDDVVRRQVEAHQGRLVRSTGDGVLATFDGPARAIRSALAIRDDVRRLGIEIRAGLHAGEVELRGDDLLGVAVHIGARVGALAGPGEVLVSRTVADLVAGSDVVLTDRGEHPLKGVPGEWRLFSAAF